MTLRILFCMTTMLAAWLGTVPVAAASPCPKPRYPSESLRNREEGISLLGFLIRADGSVGHAVLFNSSGYAALDRAAQEALAQCRYQPAIIDGKPADKWIQVAYLWSREDDRAMTRARRRAASAVEQGDVPARYHLSLLLTHTTKGDAERRLARDLLASAAALGQPHAQFEMGRRYEKGSGVEADLDEALRWYRKAAHQGDVFAIQRLDTGALP